MVFSQGGKIKYGKFEIGGGQPDSNQPKNNSLIDNPQGKGKEIKAKSKLLYVRFVHLNKKENGIPAYTREITRLEKERPVYDELIYTMIQVFHDEQEEFEWCFRSSGIVEPRTIYPFMNKLVFSDQAAIREENIVKQTIKEKSKVYVVEATICNGFQPNEEDIGTGMEYDTDHARLVVDLSSVPKIKNLMKSPPKAVLRDGNQETRLGVVDLAPSIFSVEKENLKRSQVLRIDFEIDWEKL